MSAPEVKAPDEKPPAAGWPRVGEVNVLEASIGAKGSGKSTHQVMRAYELQRQFAGAYVIGHSIGQRLPTRLPPGMYGGVELPITYHRSVIDLERGLRKAPQRWHIIAPPLAQEDRTPDRPKSSADDLLKFSIGLSHALRVQAWHRAHPLRFLPKNGASFTGLQVPPVIVILDEGVAVQAAAAGERSKGEKADWFNEYLISLRHLHIALLYAVQGATMRSWHILEQASAIHCFQVAHQWGLNAIQAAGASPEQVEQIRTLPKYHHVTISVGAK